MTDAPPTTAPTPSRRPNIPSSLKDWIYAKAVAFRYFEKGARTKEEKGVFVEQLTRKLNERYAEDTGAWDSKRTGDQLRNIKKDRWAPLCPRDENVAPAAPLKVEKPAMTKPSSALEVLLSGWQRALQSASQLNAAALARHTCNRGACNEDLVRGFLRSTLESQFVGVGTGEVLDRDLDSSAAMPRQLDVVLYNTEYPRLSPARLGANDEGCVCFYREAVIAVVEVKTTLTNQDLRDVGASARLLGREIPLVVVAFESQASLKAVDQEALPENVLGVFVLSHGSLVRGASSGDFALVYPHQRPALVDFYLCLLGALDTYARATDHERLARVAGHLRQAAAGAPQQDSPPPGSPPVRNLTEVLRQLDL